MAIRLLYDPEYMLEDCHIWDGLHPNVIGEKKMVDVVPVEWFQ